MPSIQATKDKVVPKSCLEEIQRIKPDIRVAQINGPHLVLQREPQLSAEAVTRFLEEFK